MKVSALGAAIWGARNVPCADAFISATISSSTASNAFGVRRSSFASTASFGLEYTGRPVVTAAVARRRQRTCIHGTSMLFDFIKKRAQEGVEQTQNLVSAAQEGRLEEALKDTSAYVKDRQVSHDTFCATSRVRGAAHMTTAAVDADAQLLLLMHNCCG